MTGGQPDPGFRYWAFISYSHTDQSWGTWLHKALETYPIPQRLVGMPIAAGVVPARLKPVFRDRDELPTATDLGFTIEEALRQSWCLIVICSPASARSRWVNEEVLAFQRLGRGDRIHCLIVEGAPDAHSTPCFPPALAAQMPVHGETPGEPIGADARPEGDGRAHARIKLIAGILGVPFDKLARREQQRRHRNMFLITCASLLLATLLIVFSVVTITSRRDAESQRSHAEGLVEFMLGDLRKKLEPDGKLATLDAVGKEALAYYAAQKPESLDADALARRARALQQIGEVFNLRGQLDDALGVFKQAAETTAELLQRDADNPQRIFDHAQSVFWVGYIAYQRGDFSVAEPAFQEYKQYAERLVMIEPGNEKWQAELGYANSNLGALQYDQLRLDEAALTFTRELETANSEVRKAPGKSVQQLRAGQANAWLSDIALTQGRIDAAREFRQQEVAIYVDTIGIDPKNLEALEALSIAERSLANILLCQGAVDAALNESRRAIEHALTLTNVDAENSRWLEVASAAFSTGAEASMYSGDSAGARIFANRAREYALQLIQRDPSVTVWQIRWARSVLQDAEGLAEDGLSIEALQVALGVARRLQSLPDSHVRNTERKNLLARTLLLVADQYSRLTRTAEAKATWQNVVELLDPEAGKTGPRSDALLAAALLLLEQTERARPIVERLFAIGYREPGYLKVVTNPSRNQGNPVPGQLATDQGGGT